VKAKTSIIVVHKNPRIAHLFADFARLRRGFDAVSSIIYLKPEVTPFQIANI
jgi:hypothetical protein